MTEARSAMRREDAPAIDPITLEVIRHGLVSIANQIDANIKRTAFSPYIYEYNDFAVGLVDAEGQLVAQCTGGMPPFVADSVGMAVRDGLSIYGRERLHHGDVVLCNHAAVQGQHLNNTVMYTPIYAGPRRETLIGFFAINVHWIDIGGTQANSTDIFMEGLQLRSIKLWSKGEPIEEVYRIIENNTRLQQQLMGDIAAQLAGCFLGRDLTADMANKYGVATFERTVELILDQSEAAARAFIRTHEGRRLPLRDLSRQRPLRRHACADQGFGDREGRRVDGGLHRSRRTGEGSDQFRLFRRWPDHGAGRHQISDGVRRRWPTRAHFGRSSWSCRRASS